MSVWCRSTVVLALLGMAGCGVVVSPTEQGTAQPGEGEVAFELKGPGGAALVIPVTVNGSGPYPFVLDTGATVTCVDQRLAEELELPDRPGVAGFGGGIAGVGPMRVFALDSVEVGDARVDDLLGCAIDLSPMQTAGLDIRGLLGLNFLRQYVVQLDFERRALRLERGAAEAGSRSGS